MNGQRIMGTAMVGGGAAIAVVGAMAAVAAAAAAATVAAPPPPHPPFILLLLSEYKRWLPSHSIYPLQYYTVTLHFNNDNLYNFYN